MAKSANQHRTKGLPQLAIYPQPTAIEVHGFVIKEIPPNSACLGVPISAGDRIPSHSQIRIIMCGPTADGTTTNDVVSDKSIEHVAQSDEPTDPSKTTEKREWPEDTQGLWWPYRLYLRWTYSYLSPLLTKGSQQHQSGDRLSHEDLFPVPDYMSSQHLSPQFR